MVKTMEIETAPSSSVPKKTIVRRKIILAIFVISLIVLIAVLLCVIDFHSSSKATTRKSNDGLILALTEAIQKEIQNGTLNQTKLEESKKRVDNLYAEAGYEAANCILCQISVRSIIRQRRLEDDFEAIRNTTLYMCLVFLHLSTDVCLGINNIYRNTLIYIIDNRKNLTAERVCAILTPHNKCKLSTKEQWQINVPPPSTIELWKKNDTSWQRPQKVLHLSDIHYDSIYQIKGNAKCGNIVCCETISGNPAKKEDEAGYWGDFLCDNPWHTILNTFNHIKTHHEPLDMVYFTGDIVSHRAWATSKVDNIYSIQKVFRQFQESFGSIPVYPVLGNHDPHPSFMFSPPNVPHNVSTQWVFAVVAEEWKAWLPKDTQETILRGGFYTVLVKPGFRIIALNSNVCFMYNIWLVYDDKDPYGQLQWLVATLVQAENDSESVHIISHIPPGVDGCFKTWSKEYRRIINRFSHIITGQFYGHGHKDELKIFYNTSNTQQAINIAYIGGSLTPWLGNNPTYRIYDVHMNTSKVLDYEQWIFNLTQANINDRYQPLWFKEYSFKELYGMKSLELQEFDDFLHKLATNATTLSTYLRFREGNSPSAIRKTENCDKTCLAAELCHIVKVDDGESEKCKTLQKLFFDNYRL